MKEYGKTNIEIDGKNYTLFLNRQGIVAWEKYASEYNEKINSLQEAMIKAANIDKQAKITNETNPFDGLEEFDNIDETDEVIKKSYKILYWIMLYTEHKLNIEEAGVLFDKACDIYGDKQVIALGSQMVNDANEDRVSRENKTTKKLQALRQMN